MIWEQRWHSLLEEWVVVAPHRDRRPWHGERPPSPGPALQPYDDRCTFCPGNARVSGTRNPDYQGVYVFDNDHPCVGEAAPTPAAPPPPLRASPARGRSRVVCYSPRHDLSLSRLSDSAVTQLFEVWREETERMARGADVVGVHVFENRGVEVGVSNPHPHGQIYATNFVFPHLAREARAAARHHAATGRSLLLDVVTAEQGTGLRWIAERAAAVAFVPYFARLPYETYVVPRRPCATLLDLPPSELAELASLVREVLSRMDNLWDAPFPYVLTVHQAPMDGQSSAGFQCHVEIHPPMREPGLRKYLAGPELGGGGFLLDVLPEDKAADLRDARVTEIPGSTS